MHTLLGACNMEVRADGGSLGWTLGAGSSCEMFMKPRLIYHTRTQQSRCTRADFITLSGTTVASSSAATNRYNAE